MDLESMSREELIQYIRQLEQERDAVIVFWGDKSELRETLRQVSENSEQEFTAEEARSAGLILETPGAFEQFTGLLRDSFDRGGINYAISESMSSLMQEIADRLRKH
jgi:hypothetical protein